MSAETEAVIATLETIDRRLTSIESDSADAAAFGDEAAKSLQKLQELYVSLDSKLDEVRAMIGNYVDATKELRNETRSLHTHVREKLKAAGA